MISARNYAAQAADGIIKTASLFKDYPKKEFDIKVLEHISALTKVAIHFAIPDCGKIFDDKLKGLSGVQVRLPFSAITVEYFVSKDKTIFDEGSEVYSPRRVCLAVENKVKDIIAFRERTGADLGFLSKIEDEFAISFSVMYETRSSWKLSPVTWVMPTTWEYYPSDSMAGPLLATKNEGGISGGAVISMPGVFDLLCKAHGAEKTALDAIAYDMHHEINAVMELCEALTCTNVSAKILQDSATESVNAKRARKGKVPIYETRILTIEVPGVAQGSGGKIGDRGAPRQHLRRGHIRRLPDSRKIWVNSCVVGSLKNGRIDKSYSISH